MPPDSKPSDAEEVMVHIVLKGDARASTGALEEAVKTLTEVGGLRELNRHRLDRFGIASGWVRKSSIPALKALNVVDSVTLDEVSGIV